MSSKGKISSFRSDHKRAQDKSRKKRWVRHLGVSPLTVRILGINIIALMFLAGGILYVDGAEETLIQTRVQQLIKTAEIISGALGESAAGDMRSAAIEREPAKKIILRLVSITKNRVRLFSASGELLIDSRDLAADQSVTVDELPEKSRMDEFWGRVTHVVSDVLRFLHNRPSKDKYHEKSIQKASDYREVQNAIEGTISYRIRKLSDDSDIITAAVPVQRFRRVLGALMVSMDSSDIGDAIEKERLSFLKFFVLTFILTMASSLYLARTIVGPILRLARNADRVTNEAQGNLHIPALIKRDDEIGDLAWSLKYMTQALEEQIDAVASFAADVSHEFKNPLTSLRSAVETLSLVKTAKDRKKLTDIIFDDVKRLDRLISDISAASRLESEMSKKKKTRVNLNRLFETLVDIYTVTHENKSPSFHLDIKERENKLMPYEISGLEGQIGQVARNLLDNALSFSGKEDKITIKISRDHDMVKVTIEDQGIGIPEEKLENIFDRFYSERPKGEAFGQHSGLGLSICRQVIRAHDGEIFAENRYDENEPDKITGACFTFKLPLLK